MEELTKRINSPSSICNPLRVTESFREKQVYAKEKFNRVKFLSALMKISKFRDQPDKITD